MEQVLKFEFSDKGKYVRIEFLMSMFFGFGVEDKPLDSSC